jgi:hypothetical protein
LHETHYDEHYNEHDLDVDDDAYVHTEWRQLRPRRIVLWRIALLGRNLLP